MKATIVLLMINLLLMPFTGRSQSYNEKPEVIIPLFKATELMDTLTCNSYVALRNSVTQFNFKQRNRAYQIADSLSHINYPCYEFYVQYHCTESLENRIESPIQCTITYMSCENTCTNGYYFIYKRRRFKIFSSYGTVYCDDEIK